MGTYNAKPADVNAKWYIVDLAGQNLGRSATKIAMMLMGKHKPTYTPHVDTGDYVVAINAEKVALTGKKLDDKKYYSHTGWVGGLVEKSARELLETNPTMVLQYAVKGMLPKSKLGRQMLSKLKIHAGPAPEHGYAAQKPEKLTF
ncbi:MAG: 50S ribosomal protein L13 [Proteobacteria bacterium]|jgi:large subunit ribosomal protein L13|nr:50S ribosomal protein L13 [Pseudomonadota bacterium]NLN63173.1 50S ribosomal protein L13 [Myxococcales bacterium]